MPNNPPITIPLTKGMLPDLLPYRIPEGYQQSIVGGYVSPLGIESAGTEVTNILASDYGVPLGFITCYSLAGTKYYFFATTAGKIYRTADFVTITDISKLATTYNTSARWSFAQFGDWLIATNGVEVPQVFKGISSGTNFVDLGGSPPIAKYVLVRNKSVLFAYTTESAVVYNKRVRWSAYNNAESWTASVATGAGFVDLVEFDGYITGMVHLGNGFAVGAAYSICYGGWVGGQESFRFQNLQSASVQPYSMAAVGNKVFFISISGNIWSFDGTVVDEAVGTGFDKTVYGGSLLDVLVDRQKNLVYWVTYYIELPGTMHYSIIAYNYLDNSFSYILKDRSSANGVWQGMILFSYGDTNYLGFMYKAATGNTRASYFNEATPAAITITTPEFGNGRDIMMVTNVRPFFSKISGSFPTVTLTVNTRMLEVNAATSSSSTSPNSTNGYFNVRASGRYFSVTLSYTPPTVSTTPFTLANNLCTSMDVYYEMVGQQ